MDPAQEQPAHGVASRPQDVPPPTEVTQALVERGRRGATTRRNLLTVGLITGLAATTGLAGFAFWQRAIAIANEARAKAELEWVLRTRALFLVDLARQRREAGDAATALLLALEALPDPAGGIARPYIPEAELALDQASRALRERIVLKDHKEAMTRAAFSPDGKRIVTASEDRTARLWDAETGRPIGDPLRGHGHQVWSAVFSPDGTRIVTASRDKTARVWDIATNTGEFVMQAKAAAPRCLTVAQRRSFFLDPEPPAWCIEMDKWPYQATSWKQWLADRRAGKQVEMPTE